MPHRFGNRETIIRIIGSHNPGNLLPFPSKQLYHNTAYWMDMANDNTIKNLIILALAVIIVIAIWRAIWYLAGVAVFILLVYFVYQLLKGKL